MLLTNVGYEFFYLSETIDVPLFAEFEGGFFDLLFVSSFNFLAYSDYFIF